MSKSKAKSKSSDKIKSLATGTLILGGYQQLDTTALTTAVGLTAPDNTTHVMLVCEAQNVRWRGDGTDPTASAGMIMKPTDPPLLLEIFPLSSLKFIRATAGAILNAQYFKRKP